MTSETSPEVARQSDVNHIGLAAQRYLSLFSTRLARIFVQLGLRSDPSATSTLGEREYANLAVVVTFKQCADDVLSRTDAVSPGDHYAVASRLYLDALRLAARVKHSRGDAIAETTADSASSIMTAVPASFPDVVSVEAFLDRMLGFSAADFVALAAAERMSCAEQLRSITDTVVGALSRDFEHAARRLLSRQVRFALTLAASVALVGLLSLGVDWWEAHSNVSNGKTWRASSTNAECQPVDLGGCPTRPGIFFHTKEDSNPWIEYDLEKPTRISSVFVENARDGNRERAVPLIVEVGDDQVTWREVARITIDFKEWKTGFPAVTARYVRFRVPRTTYMHLARIAVYK